MLEPWKIHPINDNNLSYHFWDSEKKNQIGENEMELEQMKKIANKQAKAKNDW